MKSKALVRATESTVDSKDQDSCEETTVFLFLLVCSLLSQNAGFKKRIEELAARLNQDSKNSDRPPSTDSPFKKRDSQQGTKGKPGAKKGHTGNHQSLLRPNKVTPVKPRQCECGNAEFPITSPFYTHQEVELPPIEMQVTHYVLLEGVCPRCGKLVKAVVPKAHESGYGPRLTALIADMTGTHGNSRGSVQMFCESVLGLPISRGAIQRAIDRASEAIEPLYQAIGQAAHRVKVNYVDETPWYQNGILMWL